MAIAAEAYKVDVYFDYACPFAWAAQLWLDDVKEELGDKLGVTWRIFPLEQANASDPDFRIWEQPNDGKSSTLRSFQGFHAAKQQGDEAFKKFHAALFRKRHVDGRNLAGQAVLESAAEDAGLDMDQFRTDLKSDDVFKQIEDDFSHSRDELSVFGTPTIMFENNEGAYLKLNYADMPSDPVEFFYDFVGTVRDRPSVIEIKRPQPMGK
ncbi:MAG: DsbA family protein [Chloroflexota bacterium]|nr:DsbA family protein [Chloroflexota bacterium]